MIPSEFTAAELTSAVKATVVIAPKQSAAPCYQIKIGRGSLSLYIQNEHST